VSACPVSVPIGTFGGLLIVDFDISRGDDVWFATLHCSMPPTIVLVKRMPHQSIGGQGLPGDFSHAVPEGCLPASNTLCLSRGKPSWQCPADVVLPICTVHVFLTLQGVRAFSGH
jgi:hypothetical protein